LGARMRANVRDEVWGCGLRMKVVFGKIYIPHLNYTVHVKPINMARTPARIHTALAYVERIDNRLCEVHMPRNDLPSSVAHELIHVLQYICEARHIDFVQEQEHMSYFMLIRLTHTNARTH